MGSEQIREPTSDECVARLANEWKRIVRSTLEDVFDSKTDEEIERAAVEWAQGQDLPVVGAKVRDDGTGIDLFFELRCASIEAKVDG